MKTNFEMYREVREHYIKHKDTIKRGTLGSEQIAVTRDTFHLAERSIIELRNLRDFIASITWDGEEDKEHDKRDMGSAIVHLIDHAIFAKGGEV